MLQGSKTYILLAVAIALAIGAFALNRIGVIQLLELLFAILSIASIRAGVRKIEISAGLVPAGWLASGGGFLPSVKTHLSVFLLIMTALIAWLQGEQGTIITAMILAAALGVSALRAALARVHHFVSSKFR